MITRFNVEGVKLIFSGGLQDNSVMQVIPSTRHDEVMKWLEGAVDEYGIPMSEQRMVPAGVGIHLTKYGKRVEGFYPQDIKSRSEKYK